MGARNFTLMSVLAFSLLAPSVSRAASVVLYSNDFESPNQPVQINCGNSLDITGINTLYGTQEFVFHQVYTVEAVAIDDTGAITTTDALRTRQHAVGLAVPLLCPN